MEQLSEIRTEPRHWTSKRILIWSLVMSFALFATIHSFQTRPSAAAIKLEDIQNATAPPRLDGDHPCVFADVTTIGVTTSLGSCSTPTTHSGSVDRFEVDLRYGAFVVRQTDLILKDVAAVPLTRSYLSQDWAHPESHPRVRRQYEPSLRHRSCRNQKTLHIHDPSLGRWRHPILQTDL